MNDYILLIALGIVCCSLAAVTVIFLHCRKVERNSNYNVAKSLREKDTLTRELERMRVEKEMTEKVLKMELSEAVKNAITGEKADECVSDCKRAGFRIDITCFFNHT